MCNQTVLLAFPTITLHSNPLLTEVACDNNHFFLLMSASLGCVGVVLLNVSWTMPVHCAWPQICSHTGPHTEGAAATCGTFSSWQWMKCKTLSHATSVSSRTAYVRTAVILLAKASHVTKPNINEAEQSTPPVKVFLREWMFLNHHLICHRSQERGTSHLSQYLSCPKHQSRKLRKGVLGKADHLLLHHKL